MSEEVRCIYTCWARPGALTRDYDGARLDTPDCCTPERSSVHIVEYMWLCHPSRGEAPNPNDVSKG